MKRREFISRVLGIGSVVLLGAGRLAKKVTPRGFVRVVKHSKYPGGFRPPHDIFSQSKWSG